MITKLATYLPATRDEPRVGDSCDDAGANRATYLLEFQQDEDSDDAALDSNDRMTSW